MLIGQGVTGVAVRKVIRGLAYPAPPTTTDTETIAEVDLSKSVIYVEQQCDADDISSRVRADLETPTKVRWNRQQATSNIELKFRVVEFY